MDNLGSSFNSSIQVGGFNENVNKSKYFCRSCKICSADFQKSFRTCGQIRNNENYTTDAVKNLNI